MFIVLLKFAANRNKAAEFMEGHKAWLQRGFDDGVFLVAGSLQSNQGGGIVARSVSQQDLQRRIDEDPFVVEKVVGAEVIGITPSRMDQRLAAIFG
jgi:uncharacterized protein YciI